MIKKTLNKLIPLMVRQAHHERNQLLTVRPEPVEGRTIVPTLQRGNAALDALASLYGKHNAGALLPAFSRQRDCESIHHSAKKCRHSSMDAGAEDRVANPDTGM